MNEKIQMLKDNIEKSIVGKEDVIVKVIAALLCEGHLLIEDVPGVGKTQLISSLAKSLDGKFNRVQMTPDIMPSDIIGFSMINQKTGELEYRPGAAMCNFLLADEINRASPKSQSSLLEVMEEGQISLDGKTHDLPKPFMVMATQNPVETYGTYHLPEAQMDRFFMKISMGYPTAEEEIKIIERTEFGNPVENVVRAVISLDDIADLQEQVKNVRVIPSVKKYITDIVRSTRDSEMVTLGVSPRGSITLYKASKAIAFINGRDYVTPDDVKYIAECVLSLRVILSVKGRTKYGSSEGFIRRILEVTPVPADAAN
ncbi:MAG: MoxR family ATPase [Oscillospiraceae bacterium]|nr:MoxR family ATPase [Oscillospiraceae bacterium]